MHMAVLNGGEIQDAGVLMCQKENWISQSKTIMWGFQSEGLLPCVALSLFLCELREEL